MVPFEGVRSAEPPNSSGSAGPSTFRAALEDCRVARDFPSLCAWVTFELTMPSKPLGRSPAMRRSSSAARAGNSA